jgi:hypothetical protein
MIERSTWLPTQQFNSRNDLKGGGNESRKGGKQKEL